MSPIITRNQTAVCLSPLYAQFTPSAQRNYEEIDTLPRWLTKTAFPHLKCSSEACLLYSDCIYARCAAGCQTPGRETQNKSGQATLIDSVGCLGPILGSLNSCKRCLRVEPISHSPLPDDGFFGLDPLRRETWGGGGGESRRRALEVSSFSAVDPVSSLGYASIQSPHQHCIFHTHTPPYLSSVTLPR